MPVMMRRRVYSRVAHVSHRRMRLAHHGQMPAQSFRRARSTAALLASSALCSRMDATTDAHLVTRRWTSGRIGALTSSR
jgi:hypothetical protein